MAGLRENTAAVFSPDLCSGVSRRRVARREHGCHRYHRAARGVGSWCSGTFPDRRTTVPGVGGAAESCPPGRGPCPAGPVLPGHRIPHSVSTWTPRHMCAGEPRPVRHGSPGRRAELVTGAVGRQWGAGGGLCVRVGTLSWGTTAAAVSWSVCWAQQGRASSLAARTLHPSSVRGPLGATGEGSTCPHMVLGPERFRVAAARSGPTPGARGMGSTQSPTLAQPGPRHP